MDKEKATKILAKELGNKVGREEVIEDFYKDNLIKNSLAVYQIGKPVIFEFYNETFHGKKGDYQSVEGLVLTYDSSFADANYYFLESIHTLSSSYSDRYSRFAATPYALIGQKEESSLRKLFYKNVQPEIAYAMSTLEVDNFIDFYKNYKESSLAYPAAPIVIKVLKEDLEVMNKFIDFATKLKYDNDEEVHKDVFQQFGGIGSLNTRLERLIEGTTIKPSRRHPERYMHREDISNVIKQVLKFMESVKAPKKCDNPLFNEFIDFVFFSLPYEEQNVGSNKLILKNSLNLDFITTVLSKEYSDGKYFREYFEVLGKEAQEEVVVSLKILSDRKPLHDSFLWSKGFKDVNLDYVNMYKKDANTFIDYLGKRTPEEKKTIIRDIMGCDFINEGVVKWLNENELELVREVGLNG